MFSFKASSDARLKYDYVLPPIFIIEIWILYKGGGKGGGWAGLQKHSDYARSIYVNLE